MATQDNLVAVFSYSLFREDVMRKMSLIGVTLAGAAILCAAPVSVQLSQDKIVSVTQDKAYAVIGRPATPGSVAGVARRSTRRAVRRHYY